jgi:hypothetical protein
LYTDEDDDMALPNDDEDMHKGMHARREKIINFQKVFNMEKINALKEKSMDSLSNHQQQLNSSIDINNHDLVSKSSLNYLLIPESPNIHA